MNSAMLIFFIERVAAWTLGSDVFKQLVKAVDEWSKHEVEGLLKKQGVANQLKAQGILMTSRALNLGCELALTYLETKAKQ